MNLANRPLFRQQALVEIAGPAHDDRLLALMPHRAWWALGALIALAGLAVAWAIVGTLPVAVQGPGLLVYPGAVVPIQSTTDGQVIELPVRAGDHVAERTLLARVDQISMREQLGQAEQLVAELVATDATEETVERDQLEAERQLRDSQERMLIETADEMSKLADASVSKNAELIGKEKVELIRMMEAARQWTDGVRTQADLVRKLAAQSLATREQVVAAESAVITAEQTLSSYQLRTSEATLKEQEARQFSFEQQSRASELRMQARQSALQWSKLSGDIQRARADRRQRIALARERVASLDRQWREASEIRAAHSGRLLEWNVEVGQVVSRGMFLGLVARDDSDREAADRHAGDDHPPKALRVVAYLPLRDGKRVLPGMKALVTPSTVKRERYGGMLGIVRRVADYPTTRSAVALALGHNELVQGVTSSEGILEVEIELSTAPTPSGYSWTTRGPAEAPSSGTTASARITVERRTPVSFLLPYARGWMYGPDPDPTPMPLGQAVRPKS